MKKILLGCPYTGLSNVRSALRELSYETNVLLAENIEGISNEVFVVNGVEYKFEEIGASFVRYPYDLIPPHSESYPLREETEYYKTIALLSDAAAINSLSSTWQFRNRGFSLVKAREYGCTVPEFAVYKKHGEFKAEKDKFAAKAIGNCFVSENVEELSSEQQEFLTIEEDDGDVAAVFPASLFNNKQLSKYLSLFDHAFCQQVIYCKVELRCYFIEDTFFVYQRDGIERFDKSFASYLKTTYSLTSKTKIAVTKLARNYRLDYLCFDIVVDETDSEYVIDINPYGSFPPYDKLPDVSIALAECLYKRANNG